MIKSHGIVKYRSRVCRPEGVSEVSFSSGCTDPYIATTRFLSGCERTLSVLDTKDLCCLLIELVFYHILRKAKALTGNHSEY